MAKAEAMLHPARKMLRSGANFLATLLALRYTVKYVSGTGQRSPPRGGADPSAHNQQLLVAGDDEDDAGAGVGGTGAATCWLSHPCNVRVSCCMQQIPLRKSGL